MSFVRKQLPHGSGDNIRKCGETRLIILFCKPIEYRTELKNENIYMIILNRYISPTARFETKISQHLTISKRNIPHIIPGKCKISSFTRKIGIMFSLFPFRNQCQIISCCSCIERSLLIFTIRIERRRKIIGFRYQLFLQIISRMLGTLQIAFIPEVLISHDEWKCCRRSTSTTFIGNGKIILKLTGETAISILNL